MPDLVDFYPEFASRSVSTEAGKIFARTGGSGPPLVLVHGFPETMAMWHRLVPDLAGQFTVVLLDLRGYGWSSAPGSHKGEGYSKRVMGADVVAVMEELGHAQFAYVGHDRGARVGYRLALDHPGRISRLALLDIIPTMEMWKQIEAGQDIAPHWTMLAEPEPGPETTLAKDPDGAFGGMMAKWSGTKSLDAFDPRALAHYRAGWGDPTRIHAMCEDYRAGATLDRQADEADAAAGKTTACPVLTLAGSSFLQAKAGETVLDVWRRTFAPKAEGLAVECGHFVAEENPSATLAGLMPFLTR